jgi:hypothetical protein
MHTRAQHYTPLSQDFDPETFQNRAALGLLQRFVSNGRESDGSPTRERLKMIVRCCNAEEWAAAAPLNSAEYKLLVNYNEKPVLTRPQVRGRRPAGACLAWVLEGPSWGFVGFAACFCGWRPCRSRTHGAGTPFVRGRGAARGPPSGAGA